MTFQPIANYAGYNHVLLAGANWTHPGNGNTYCCACEQLSGVKQNLSVYRMPPGGDAWEHVETFEGTVDAVAQITMGAASIEPDGSLLVETSLIIKDAPRVTKTGFQGCWVRLPKKDDPYTLPAVLLARIAMLESALASLPPTVTGPIVRIPAQTATEGGELQLLYNGGVYFFDVSNGVLRAVKQEAGQPGRVLQTWGG